MKLVLVEKPKCKGPLWRPRRRWEDNIRMDLQDWGLESGLDRSALGWGQLAGICECGNEPLGFIKFREIRKYMKTFNF